MAIDVWPDQPRAADAYRTELVRRLGGREPIPAALLERARPYLDARLYQSLVDRNRSVPPLLAREVRVVFGGHFSCGKSSMINMVMGQPLLPTGDLPETGVACEVRSGDAPQALVVTATQTLSMPLSTSTISANVSLIGRHGEVREQISEVLRVMLTVPGAPVGQHTVWVDSPGINDGSSTRETSVSTRAARVADEADILVWIVNSQQPMSIVEVTFLRDFVQRRHAKQLVFLVNSFLPTDTAAGWNYFIGKLCPAIRLRIEAMDLAPMWNPEIVFASARAAISRADAFGGPQARQLLANLGDPAGPRAAVAACQRVRDAFLPLSNEVAAAAGDTDQTLRHQQASVTAQREQAAKRRERFESEVRSACAVAFAARQPAARGCGSQVAAEVGEVLHRDATYTQSLQRKLTDIGGQIAEDLVERLVPLARDHQQTALSPDAKARLRALLTAAQEPVEVPNMPVAGKKPGAGAVIGGVLGFIVGGPVGAAAGAAIGGFAGGAASGVDAVERDRAGTRGNAIEAGNRASATLMAKQHWVERLILTDCRQATATPGEPSTASRDVLFALRDRLAAVVRTCAELADEVDIPTSRWQADPAAF